MAAPELSPVLVTPSLATLLTRHSSSSFPTSSFNTELGQHSPRSPRSLVTAEADGASGIPPLYGGSSGSLRIGRRSSAASSFLLSIFPRRPSECLDSGEFNGSAQSPFSPSPDGAAACEFPDPSGNPALVQGIQRRHSQSATVAAGGSPSPSVTAPAQEFLQPPGWDHDDPLPQVPVGQRRVSFAEGPAAVLVASPLPASDLITTPTPTPAQPVSLSLPAPTPSRPPARRELKWLSFGVLDQMEPTHGDYERIASPDSSAARQVRTFAIERTDVTSETTEGDSGGALSPRAQAPFAQLPNEVLMIVFEYFCCVSLHAVCTRWFRLLECYASFWAPAMHMRFCLSPVVRLSGGRLFQESSRRSYLLLLNEERDLFQSGIAAERAELERQQRRRRARVGMRCVLLACSAAACLTFLTLLYFNQFNVLPDLTPFAVFLPLWIFFGFLYLTAWVYTITSARSMCLVVMIGLCNISAILIFTFKSSPTLRVQSSWVPCFGPMIAAAAFITTACLTILLSWMHDEFRQGTLGSRCRSVADVLTMAKLFSSCFLLMFVLLLPYTWDNGWTEWYAYLPLFAFDAIALMSLLHLVFTLCQMTGDVMASQYCKLWIIFTASYALFTLYHGLTLLDWWVLSYGTITASVLLLTFGGMHYTMLVDDDRGDAAFPLSLDTF